MLCIQGDHFTVTYKRTNKCPQTTHTVSRASIDTPSQQEDLINMMD